MAPDIPTYRDEMGIAEEKIVRREGKKRNEEERGAVLV